MSARYGAPAGTSRMSGTTSGFRSPDSREVSTATRAERIPDAADDIPSFFCVGGPGSALSLPLGEGPLPHGEEQREHEGVGRESGEHDIDPAASKTESA